VRRRPCRCPASARSAPPGGAARAHLRTSVAMRFDSVRARLVRLPERLPRGTRAIDPVLLPLPGGGLPTWTRAPATQSRRAAALVLLYPDAAGETRIVLTERPETLRHGGQVSLPGGREDPGDEFPTGTALREATEEVGLDAAAADVRVV